MRAVIQRVKKASVTVEEIVIGSIETGYLIFLGIDPKDALTDQEWLIKKITTLKLFPDTEGRMSKSLLDVEGSTLIISQFTLHASTKKGTRPSFHRSAPPELAEKLYDSFCEALKTTMPHKVQTGKFGAHMDICLLNDGPVTLILDSKSPE